MQRSFLLSLYPLMKQVLQETCTSLVFPQTALQSSHNPDVVKVHKAFKGSGDPRIHTQRNFLNVLFSWT